MSFKAIFLLACLLALTTAFGSQPVKSFLSSADHGTFSQPFIRTNTSTIAYGAANVTGSEYLSSRYVSIDFEEPNVVPILQDTLAACGQVNSTYSRLYYHASLSTLVYYCTANNTLLILNETDYSLKRTIAVSVSGQFNETKITAEGSTVVILGIAAPFSNDGIPIPAQLIKINLINYQITSQITFTTGLQDLETVTAYASTGVLSYILTAQVDFVASTMTSTIYSMIFTPGTSLYQLIKLAKFTDTLIQPFRTSELLILGSYLVTNSYNDLLFFNVQGKLASNLTDLHFYPQIYIPYPQRNNSYYEVPTYAMQQGTSNLYAYFNNNSVIQVSSSGFGLSSESIYEADDLMFAIGNRYAHDLLFDDASFNFTVLDLQTSEVYYSAPNYYTELYLTNNTFLDVYYSYTVLNRTTNNALKNLTGGYYWTDKYDENNQVLYYVDYNFSSYSTTNCTVMYIQPETLAFGVVFNFDIGYPCQSATFIDVSSTDDIASPNLSISFLGSAFAQYVIYTKEYGQVNFTSDYGISQIITIDYDNMYLYEALSYPNSGIQVYLYSFNGTSFVYASNYANFNINYPNQQNYLVLDNLTLVLYSNQQFALIDIKAKTSNQYDVPFVISSISGFHNDQDQLFLILAGAAGGDGLNYPPYVLGPDKIPSPVLEADEYTSKAGAAGRCIYWFSESYVIGFEVVKFNSICSEDMSDAISM